MQITQLEMINISNKPLPPQYQELKQPPKFLSSAHTFPLREEDRRNLPITAFGMTYLACKFECYLYTEIDVSHYPIKPMQTYECPLKYHQLAIPRINHSAVKPSTVIIACENIFLIAPNRGLGLTLNVM